jgi:hypothetical protein
LKIVGGQPKMPIVASVVYGSFQRRPSNENVSRRRFETLERITNAEHFFSLAKQSASWAPESK